MTINTPITNAPLYYINGLELAWVNTTSMTVNSGRCRDSTNANDISVGLPYPVAATQTGVEPVAAGTGLVTITTTTSGIGGLDTGTIAASTFYAVYVIGDSNNILPGTALISANLTAPIFPSGYDMKKRVGYIKTDGSSHILPFRQDGTGLDRWMWYDASIATSITAGASATYVAVDASAALPFSTPTMVNWACVFTPTGAGNTLVLAPGTSTSTNGYASASGAVAAVAQTVDLVCPTDSPNTAAIVYKVTGSAVAINVQAYLDQLVVNPLA